MRVLVTGGAGFIGSALVRHLIAETDHDVLNLDKLTYAASVDSITPVAGSTRYAFVQADIGDTEKLAGILSRFDPHAIMNLAAETHVDRSIDSPDPFITTNIIGTYGLLRTAVSFWRGLPGTRQDAFRFIHVSTDEVFGSLAETGLFEEVTRYDPRSPYSASKASSDHLARAWHHTYGLPVLVTNCCNNYGPYQFPEKLIPLTILKALAGEKLPLYGRGENVRDWLYVDDHVRALCRVLEAGRPGETYNIGATSERTNLMVVQTICRILDELQPRQDGSSYADRISFVADRPGHDFRYAVDASKIKRELGWYPRETFETGIIKTVRWYLQNERWWKPSITARNLGERLGLRENNPD